MFPYRTLAFSLALFSTTTGLAQVAKEGADAAEGVIAEMKKADQSNEPTWKPSLKLGATGSFAHSSSVIGQPDGTTLQIGATIDAGLVFQRDTHRWTNTLGINETVSRTPSQDRLMKAADSLKLVSKYVYGWKKAAWAGTYLQGSFETALFNGYDVLQEGRDVTRISTDGTSETHTKRDGKQIRLTDPFEPIVLKESAGLVAKPIESDLLTANVKLGAGGQHILVGDAFRLADDDTTPALELVQLQSSSQGGALLEADAAGKFADNITYSAGASVFWPFAESIDNGPSGVDAVSLSFDAKLSVKIKEWLAIDYILSAKRLPLLLEDWQVQNNVLASFSYSII